MDMASPFTVGHHDSKKNIAISTDLIDQVHESNYEVMTFPITAPHFHSRVLSKLSSIFTELSSGIDDDEITRSRNASPLIIEPLSPFDSNLTPSETLNSVIARTSSWIDLASPDPIIADVSRQVLKMELAYAAFCGVSYVLISGPRISNLSDVNAYGRAILDGLSQGPYMQIYLWIGAVPDLKFSCEQIGDLSAFARREYVHNLDEGGENIDSFLTWQSWDRVRSICKYSTRLCVALALPQSIPPTQVLSRWYSEPVRMITLDKSTFKENAKGYPSLTFETQQYILRLTKLKITPWIILADTVPLRNLSDEPGMTTNGDFPSIEEAKKFSTIEDPYLLYVRNLQKKQPPLSAMDHFAAGYQDYLQAPLQPLTVNLESVTYEVFEKDPIKYEWYERATALALQDWIAQGKPTSNPDGRVVVAVVGAGRGPLVTRALQAAMQVGVDIDMWALEKNQNAFVLLQQHNVHKWNDQVSLVRSDMRTWSGPQTEIDPARIGRTYNLGRDHAEENDLARSQTLQVLDSHDTNSSYNIPQVTRYKVDILISELLGSFADNELSPECLDGVQHLLNPTHGISIPASYTAHFTPVAAPKLHADISLSMTNTNPTAAEVPYVVMLDAIDFLSTMITTAPPLGHQNHANNGSNPTKPKSFASLFSSTSNNTKSSIIPPRASSTVPAMAATQQPVIHTAWSFHHPNHTLRTGSSSNAHNARYTKSSFPIPWQGTCHGLAGYFETVLYPGVELSTNPLTMEQKSAGMISWFPIFFPFKTPLFLPKGGVVDVSMWRQTDDRRVWYEWIAEVFITVGKNTDANDGGKGMMVKVGASDLHSSEKEACLM